MMKVFEKIYQRISFSEVTEIHLASHIKIEPNSHRNCLSFYFR